MNLSRPDRAARLDALAALYALGTLSPAARRRLAAVAREDSVVAMAINEWQLRLASLAQDVPGITPSPRVWEAIRRRLYATYDLPVPNGPLPVSSPPVDRLRAK